MFERKGSCNLHLKQIKKLYLSSNMWQKGLLTISIKFTIPDFAVMYLCIWKLILYMYIDSTRKNEIMLKTQRFLNVFSSRFF